MEINKKIAVLIPCYNESAAIKKVVKDFKTALPQADIYVYDNNSTDHTDKIAKEAGAMVDYERRQGKGNVIRTMFRNITADCYIIVDGDDTYPAEFARKMSRMILEQDMDMVIGDRLSSTYFTENKRPFHNFGNRFVCKLINAFFHGNVTDVMTGYRALSFTFVKSFPVLSKGFEIETEMTIHALDKNFNICSVPVTYRDRKNGSVSKLNTYSDGFKVLFTIFSLYKNYRPFPFFSLIALLLILIAAILFIPILFQFFCTGLVLKIPTLIISGFLALAAMLSFVCGLILSTEEKKEKQHFEVQMNILQILKNITK